MLTQQTSDFFRLKKNESLEKVTSVFGGILKY